MAAGNYNPNSSSSRPSGMKTISTSGTKAAASNPTAGSSYSVGASVGGRILKRFVLQGGVSHLTQNSGYTSSTAMGKSVTLNEFTATNNQTSVTSPYDVSSTLQFLSLPVQAGYVLLDRNLSIQVNGGVATDFFLQGVLTSSDAKLEKVSYRPGADSPYRNVNFSGLVGTEVSYKVGKNYRIAVNPGMRYALNSIYKSEVNSQTLPITFDVGLNFRYIFN
jgi:putative salt-induced outer membrane protein YdiY